MTLFEAWLLHHTPAQQAVARGEAVFDSKSIYDQSVLLD